MPSYAEWNTLATFLGGASVAGGKLKEAGTTHWAAPNTDATNETGFTAVPSGDRRIHGVFMDFGYRSCWHSSTLANTGSTWYHEVRYNNSGIERWTISFVAGYSVRCIKD